MSRVRFVSLLLGLIVAGSATAAAQCGSRPQAPDVPNGGNAQIESMKTASKAVESYAEAMNKYADCLIEHAQSAIDERNEMVQRWNEETDKFNARLSSDE
jgi:hypothetical protein